MLVNRSVVSVAYSLIEGAPVIEIDCNKIETSCNFSLHCELPTLLKHGLHFFDRLKLGFIVRVTTTTVTIY